MLAGLNDAADPIEPEVPIVVGDAAAADPFDAGDAERDPVRELPDRNVDRHVLLQP
jgi:hypothetical protein